MYDEVGIGNYASSQNSIEQRPQWIALKQGFVALRWIRIPLAMYIPMESTTRNSVFADGREKV